MEKVTSSYGAGQVMLWCGWCHVMVTVTSCYGESRLVMVQVTSCCGEGRVMIWCAPYHVIVWFASCYGAGRIMLW